MEIKNDIEKHSKLFLDINENENFIIKDRIKFELETNYYKNSKIKEEV